MQTIKDLQSKAKEADLKTKQEAILPQKAVLAVKGPLDGSEQSQKED